MKRILTMTYSVAMLATALSAATPQWPDVAPEARPGTRWWWLGSAVDSAGIHAAITDYSSHGIGSVEITPIYGVQDNEKNELSYLSPEWMAALRQVQAASDASGVLVDMNQGTGWPFGGPEVTMDHAACKVMYLVDTVASGAAPVKVLPEKERNDALPIADSRRRLPDGRDEVIRLFQGHTRQAVKRAAPGGEGLVMDHFSREAVAAYLDKFDKAFTSTSTPWPHNFFNDSYEVYNANWTPGLFEEFEARRGYRLQDHLPEFIGTVDDNNQVLLDYRRTLADLLLENFTRQWVDWGHKRGIAIRNQAHGSPANLIDLYAEVDIPEIEGFGLSDFGIKGLRTDSARFIREYDCDLSMLKYASSAAHITAKPLTSAETFTWLTEHFRTSLSQMKPDLDLMFTCGVNHMFFHGTAYSPVNDPWPGWKFYASIDMSPTNSIWRDAPALMEYITRSQSFLQTGRPDNDFLVYLPLDDIMRQRMSNNEKGLMMTFAIHGMRKKAEDFVSTIFAIDSLGYDSDYISDRYLMTTGYDGEKLVTAGGARYNALVIPLSGTLGNELKAHLDSLSAMGAHIIYGIDGKAMSRYAHEPMRTDLGLRAMRRADPDGHHYFIVNLTPDDIDGTVPLAVDFTDAVWFDPMTGAITRAEVTDGKVAMNFRSGESRILRTYDHAVDLPAVHSEAVAPMTVNLTERPWTLEFIESVPAITGTRQLKSLRPWTDLGDADLDRLMGTGVYTTRFTMKPDDLKGKWSIELGDVRESARVYLNGQLVGTAWAVPFVLDCTDALKAGDNELRIEVTNLPANRIADLDRKGVKWRKFKEINMVGVDYKKTDYSDWATVTSGLNSAVTLHRR